MEKAQKKPGELGIEPAPDPPYPPDLASSDAMFSVHYGLSSTKKKQSLYKIN